MSDSRNGNPGPYGLTGGVASISGGIGAASARRLPGFGAMDAIGHDSGRDRAEALAAELRGGGHLPLHLPMTDSAGIRAAAADAEAKLGRADMPVNSSGTTRAVAHAALEAATRSWTHPGHQRARPLLHHPRLHALLRP